MKTHEAHLIKFSELNKANNAIKIICLGLSNEPRLEPCKNHNIGTEDHCSRTDGNWNSLGCIHGYWYRIRFCNRSCLDICWK